MSPLGFTKYIHKVKPSKFQYMRPKQLPGIGTQFAVYYFWYHMKTSVYNFWNFKWNFLIKTFKNVALCVLYFWICKLKLVVKEINKLYRLFRSISSIFTSRLMSNSLLKVEVRFSLGASRQSNLYMEWLGQGVLISLV